MLRVEILSKDGTRQVGLVEGSAPLTTVEPELVDLVEEASLRHTRYEGAKIVLGFDRCRPGDALYPWAVAEVARDRGFLLSDATLAQMVDLAKRGLEDVDDA